MPAGNGGAAPPASAFTAAERRVIGEIDAAEFVRHLQRATGSAP